MKKILFILLMLIFMFMNSVTAKVIEGNISITDSLPSELFGYWQVESYCTRNTNRNLFESGSSDIWTLSRNGDTVTLTNPLTGASANINVREVKGKTVKFEKRSISPDEESIETPILTLNGDNFRGVDKIIIKRYDKGKLIREDYVEYQVRGTKISGSSIGGIFGTGI